MLYVRNRQASMVPTMTDANNVVEAFKYNIGVSNKAPRMPRFNFMEKMEYWAMLWGFLVMAITGFMLWNPIATASLLPGQFIPAAKVAHGGEAVLAVLAIIIWHFYNVHIKSLNTSMFTGKISRHEMVEEHALELEAIEKGAIPPVPPAHVQRRRLTIFAPIALVLAAAMLFGIYRFVTFEQTAITTLPPAEQEQPIFVPQTATPESSEPTLAPTVAQPSGEAPAEEAALTWNATVGPLFDQRCSACHGSMGGFSAQSYQDVLKAVTPGDPAGSAVIQVQQGAHPGKFEDDELLLIQKWIQAGAPE
jgi:mono/diheme cytochrome c family protein